MINRNSRPWLDRLARRASSVSARALEERAGRGPAIVARTTRARAAQQERCDRGVGQAARPADLDELEHGGPALQFTA